MDELGALRFPMSDAQCERRRNCISIAHNALEWWLRVSTRNQLATHACLYASFSNSMHILLSGVSDSERAYLQTRRLLDYPLLSI
jgi:hypothetical protein